VARGINARIPSSTSVSGDPEAIWIPAHVRHADYPSM
jgi:hypothetical protein